MHASIRAWGVPLKRGRQPVEEVPLNGFALLAVSLVVSFLV
jgi:hypothetical protein